MPVITLTKADDGGSLEVRQGDTLVLNLPENPTTGYRWAVDDANAGALQFEHSNYSPSTGAGIGGGGVRTFTFYAKSPGSAILKLKLWREWAGDASISDRFSVTIKVMP